jgi:rare lipoprotein A
MRPTLAVREIALAGLALLAVAVSLAISAQVRDAPAHSLEPEGSYPALAGSSGPGAFGKRTACGIAVDASTQGIANPTLPCGVQIFVTYRGKTVLVRVIDHGPNVPGRQFDVTDALARRLGLSGVQQIHWSYAQAR